MRWFGGVVGLLLIGATCAPLQAEPAAERAPAATAAPGASADAEWLEVRAVSVEAVGNGRRVLIALTRAPESIEDSGSATPPRLVIDMRGPRPATPVRATPYPLSDDVVSQVRVGSHGEKLRAVIDLAEAPGPHRVRVEGTMVIAEIGDVSGSAETGAQASAAGADSAPAVAEEAWLAVRDVQVSQTDGGRRLTILLSRAPEGVRDFVLDGPPRLVMDLRGPLPEHAGPTRFPVSDDLVSRVRVGANGNTLRVVADLRAPAGAHSVRQEGARLIADLGDVPLSNAAPAGGVVLASALVGEAANTPAAAPSEPAAAPSAPAAAPSAPAAAPAEMPAELPPATAAARAPTEAAPRIAPMRTAMVPEDVPPSMPPRMRAAAGSGPGGPGSYKGQRISLDFKDADIHNVLRVLADVSNLNIIATDDVRGKITLHLTDVPWDQALDLVLRSNRLEMNREGNVVRISTVARLKEEREALRAAQDAETELEPLRVKYVKVNYARADEALVDKVKGVLTDRGGVTFDDRTNTIIVRDIPRGINEASELIHELDVQSPQVLIEANIVEATEDFARGLGVQWGYVYNGGPQTGTATGSNFPGTIGIGGSGVGAGAAPPSATGAPRVPVPFLADFPVPSSFGSGFGPGAGSALNLALGSLDGANTLTARLTALEEDGKGRVISRPRVITLNNVAATIQSLTILRVKLPSTGTVINTGTGGAAGTASTATEKINTGITLVVTPQISSDGYVLLNIYAKSSVPDFSRTVEGIPTEISREANSNVLIRDAETVVLGGVFRNLSDDRQAGVPYLEDVPVIGWLFKRVLSTRRRDEMLVFLTPKILAGPTANLPAASRLWEGRQQGG